MSHVQVQPGVIMSHIAVVLRTPVGVSLDIMVRLGGDSKIRGLQISLILLTGLALSSVAATATGSATLFNEMGWQVHGLRVVFDQPVTIVRMGEAFAEWSPEGDGTSVVFSEGTIDVWGDFYFSWEPTDGRLIRHEWLVEPTTTSEDK